MRAIFIRGLYVVGEKFHFSFCHYVSILVFRSCWIRKFASAIYEHPFFVSTGDFSRDGRCQSPSDISIEIKLAFVISVVNNALKWAAYAKCT